MAIDKHRFSVAPMMNWTDRHDRVFLRLFSKNMLLYTEMITSKALKFGDPKKLLAHSSQEHPVALQVGGSEPREMAYAAQLGEEAGFKEININVGCPSSRVQSGMFGACLMREPHTVAECFHAMQKVVTVPVSVKCRIGVDESADFESLADFVATVASAGCRTFIIHARKAILGGLSPKENREIPPLNYERVYEIKRHFPQLHIIINGGITDPKPAFIMLEKVDGVMIGREAYQNPYILADIDRLYYENELKPRSRFAVLDEYTNYIEQQLAEGIPLQNMTRHILGLFKGQIGGKAFRRYLSEHAHKKNAGKEVVLNAKEIVLNSQSKSMVYI
ncbi:MAG: tRNA dihydrouridine(20/20a) synthase DusA [Gammaproteobacteria bacterium]|nr:tRNA dihydrouridine(20/20a) synthase DusA [Gammaproteobacteria bacterium]